MRLDQNHDDLVLPGDSLPEAPFDGTTYGRGGGGWYRVLPLSGGQLTGSLLTNAIVALD
jgi:hypothetical protein